MRCEVPKNANHYLGNGCAGIFLIVLGLGFVGIPLQDGVPLGLFHDAYATVSFLLFEAVGLLFLGGGVWFLFQWSAFCKPAVEISPDVRPGEQFDFRYRQQVRRSVRVRAIDVFFDYREKVERGNADDRSTDIFDRLISRGSYPGGTYAKGEEIAFDSTFTVPAGEMGVRNPYTRNKKVILTCLWVVRVRIQFGRSSEIWEDHEIEVAEPSGRTAEPSKGVSALFDVVMLPTPIDHITSTSKALGEVAPHLYQSGLPLAAKRAAVVCERVDETEAQRIADVLRAASATVEVVPTEATWWLPTAENEQAQPDRSANLSA